MIIPGADPKGGGGGGGEDLEIYTPQFFGIENYKKCKENT